LNTQSKRKRRYLRPSRAEQVAAFGRSKWSKLLAIGIILAATILAIMYPAFVPYYLSAAIGASISLLSGGIWLCSVLRKFNKKRRG